MTLRTYTTFAAILAALLAPTTATAGTYTDSDAKQFTEAAAQTEFTFANLPEAVGDVGVTVELSGAYGDTAGARAYASVAIDGTAQSNLCESGCGEGCITGHTHTFTVDASTVADGRLTVGVDNSEGVHARCRPSRIGVSVEYPTNDPPTAEGAEIRLDEDTSKTIRLSAADPNGDPLTWEYTELPSHGQLSGLPPEVTYTPDVNYHGEDRFGFVVSDDRRETSSDATVAVTVDPVNDPPEWTRPDQTDYEIRAGDPFTLVVEATDVDDETLEYGMESIPANSSFSPETGTLEWTPSDAAIDDQTGDHTLTFTATDGDATITRDIRVTVHPDPMPDTGIDAAGGDAADDATAGDTAAAPDTDASLDAGRNAADTNRPDYGLRGGGCTAAPAGDEPTPGALGLLLFVLFAAGAGRAKLKAES